jgi:hypothetical protein
MSPRKLPPFHASTRRINANRDLANYFIGNVLELEWAFVTDESSLADFEGVQSSGSLVERIKEVYGVDVSDIGAAPLCEILETIAAKNLDWFARSKGSSGLEQ